MPPTHFVSDGLQVRSQASKFHVSVLITFQLGALENTIKERVSFRDLYVPPSAPSELSQPREKGERRSEEWWPVWTSGQWVCPDSSSILMVVIDNSVLGSL